MLVQRTLFFACDDNAVISVFSPIRFAIAWCPPRQGVSNEDSLRRIRELEYFDINEVMIKVEKSVNLT